MPDSIERENLKTRLRSHLLEIVRERDPYLSTQGHFYVSVVTLKNRAYPVGYPQVGTIHELPLLL